MPYPDVLTDLFQDLRDKVTATIPRLPVSGEISGHNGTSCSVVIPSFDENQVFKGVQYTKSPPLADGTTICVAFDENDTLWVLAP